jgi:hypothetical protein
MQRLGQTQVANLPCEKAGWQPTLRWEASGKAAPGKTHPKLTRLEKIRIQKKLQETA